METTILYEVRTIEKGRIDQQFAKNLNQLFSLIVGVGDRKIYVYKIYKSLDGTILSSEKLDYKLHNKSFLIKKSRDKPIRGRIKKSTKNVIELSLYKKIETEPVAKKISSSSLRKIKFTYTALRHIKFTRTRLGGKLRHSESKAQRLKTIPLRRSGTVFFRSKPTAIGLKAIASRFETGPRHGPMHSRSGEQRGQAGRSGRRARL